MADEEAKKKEKPMTFARKLDKNLLGPPALSHFKAN